MLGQPLLEILRDKLWAVVGPDELRRAVFGDGGLDQADSLSGNGTYNPAPDWEQTITVAKAPLTIKADDKSTVQGAAMPDLTLGYTGFVNGDTFFVSESLPTITTTVTTTTPPGKYAIIPAGGGDADYALTLQNGQFTVMASNAAPIFTRANNATFMGGQAGSFTVTATGTPTPTYSTTGLPSWASLNSTTGVLSGTPPVTETVR